MWFGMSDRQVVLPRRANQTFHLAGAQAARELIVGASYYPTGIEKYKQRRVAENGKHLSTASRNVLTIGVKFP